MDFDKKETQRFTPFTVGSVCSVYPSSARRGLVIFHEHIADLLSGGVSLFFFSIARAENKCHFPSLIF